MALFKEKKRAFKSEDKQELRAVQKELRRMIREGKARYRRRVLDQLQQNMVSGVCGRHSVGGRSRWQKS